MRLLILLDKQVIHLFIFLFLKLFERIGFVGSVRVENSETLITEGVDGSLIYWTSA